MNDIRQTDPSELFVRALIPAQRALVRGRDAELRAVLEQLASAAAAAHPRVLFPRSALAQELAGRVPSNRDPLESLRQIHATDVYLACACAAGDEAAVQSVDALLRAEVEIAAVKVRAPASLIDDVTQHLREHLLVRAPGRPAAVSTFAGSGDLRGFLRVTALRELLRLLKRRGREQTFEADELSAMIPAADPVLESLKQTYRRQFARCFAAAVASMSTRERSVLRYNVLDRLSVDQIGALYRVHRATAARWLERVRVKLASETEARLARELSLTPTEIASVIRLVRSQLEVSLPRLLSAEPQPAHP